MTTPKPQLYATLLSQLTAMLQAESDSIANAANTAALIYHSLHDLNWVGFYFLRGEELVVGPFQGMPACTRIPLGRGVCGTAVERRCTIVVEDVHSFAGHIACDTASKSEIVIPLEKHGRLIGVLDLDSPSLGRFDADDQAGLERLAGAFVESIKTW